MGLMGSLLNNFITKAPPREQCQKSPTKTTRLDGAILLLCFVPNCVTLLVPAPPSPMLWGYAMKRSAPCSPPTGGRAAAPVAPWNPLAVHCRRVNQHHQHYYNYHHQVNTIIRILQQRGALVNILDHKLKKN